MAGGQSNYSVNINLGLNASGLQPGIAQLNGFIQYLEGPGQKSLSTFTGSLNTLLGRLPLVGPELTNIVRIGSQLTSTFQGLSAAGGGFGTALGGLAGGLGLVGAAGITAVGIGFKLADSYAQVGRQIALFSEQTGLSTENVSGLRVGMKALGKDVTDLSQPFFLYLRNLSEAAHGNKTTAETFQRFGISARQAKELLKDPNAALEDLIKRLGEIQNPAERADAAFKLAGRGARDLALIAADSQGDLANLRAEAAKLGESFSQEDADNAKEFEKQLALLKLQAEGVGFKIGKEVMPTIQRAVDDLSSSLENDKDDWDKLGHSLNSFIEDTITVGKAIVGLYSFLDELGNKADQAGDKVYNALIRDQQYQGSDPNIKFGLALAQTGLAYVQSTGSPPPYSPGKGSNQPNPDDLDNPYYLRLSGSASALRAPYRSQIGNVQGRGGGRDAADDAMRELQDQIAQIDKLAQTRREKLDQLFRLGLVNLADYTTQATDIEQKRYADASALLDKQYNEALSKKKGSSVAVADVNKRIDENEQQHQQTTNKIQEQSLQQQIELLKSRSDSLLAIQDEADQRQIALLRNAADERAITYTQAEDKIDAIEKAAYERHDKADEQFQALYARGTRQFQEYAQKRALAKEQETTREINAALRFAEAARKEIDRIDQIDKSLKAVAASSAQARSEINAANIDQLERLGANPKYIRQLRVQSLGGEYLDQKEQLRRDEADLIRTSKATGDLKLQIEQEYQTRLTLLDQEYEAKRRDLLLQPLYQYAEKVHELAGEVGDVFGNAFASIGQKGKSFFQELRSGFADLWRSIIHDFVQSQVRKVIESLFNPLYQSTSSGSGGGFSLGNIFSHLFGGLFGGGSATTPGFNPNAGTPNVSNAANLISLVGSGALFGGSTAGPSFFGSGLSSSLAANFVSGLLGGTPAGQSILPAPSATDATLARTDLGKIFSSATGAGTTAASTAALAGHFSLSGLGASLGPLLPLLGLGAGIGIGSPSGIGSILGGAGGLLLGGAGLAALAPGVLAGILGGGSVSILGPTGAAISTSFTGLGGAAIGLLTNPFTIAAGAALIAGALILGHNAARRRDERTRDQLATDARSQVYQLIADVNADRVSPADAGARYLQIKTAYLQQAQLIHDRKTRDHAIAWWQDVEKQILPLLQKSVEAANTRQAIAGQLHQTYEFSTGGAVWPRFANMPRLEDGGALAPMMASNYDYLGTLNGSMRVPGLGLRKDDKLIAVTGREVVLTEDDWRPIESYLRVRRVKGFQEGGRTSDEPVIPAVKMPVMPSAPSVKPKLEVSAVVHLDAEALAKGVADVLINVPGYDSAIAKAVINTQEFPKGVVHSTRRARRLNQL